MGDTRPGIVLRPSGDLDLATVDRFRASVDTALAQAPQALVVDLAAVDFLDSSGIAVLAAALKAQRSGGRAIAAVNPQPIVRHAIELVGLSMLFDVSGIPAPLLDGEGS